jgi:hypothetical protein
MSDIISKLEQGIENMQPSDYQKLSQAVGSTTPEQLGSAATQAVSQVDPNEYAQHIQAGAAGTTPVTSLPREQQTGIAQSLISALLSSGLSHSDITQGAGVPSLNPKSLSANDLVSLLQWAQQNKPQALGNVAAQYQNQPNLLSSILGNKALMSTVASVGMQFLSNEMGHGSAPTQGPAQ